MRYATLEVELRDGRVIPRDGEVLPVAARALLVVLDPKAASRKEEVGDLSQTVSLIRARQTARGHSPRSADAVSQQVRRERESWE